MTCIETLGSVASQVLKGVMFHVELTDLFDFLSLKGFYKWQKHQLEDGLKNLDYIKHYAFKKYHMFLDIHKSEETYGIIPEGWKNQSSLKATSADIVSTIKNVLNLYLDYEEEAAKNLKNLVEEANEMDKDIICELYKETCEEIMHIEQIKLKLQTTNYNALHIQILSDKLCDKYGK